MSNLIGADNLGRDDVTQGSFKLYIEQLRQFIEDSIGTDSETALSNLIYDNTLSGLTSTDAKSAIDELEKHRNQISINFLVDTDLTLNSIQNQYGRLILTDTEINLTASKNVIISNISRRFLVKNDTLQTLTFKTSLGGGIAVASGVSKDLFCNGTDIIEISLGSVLDINSLTLKSTPIRADKLVVADSEDTFTNKGTEVGELFDSFLSSTSESQAQTDDTSFLSPLKLKEAFQGGNQGTGYQKLPGGKILQWGYTLGTGNGQRVTLPISFPSSMQGLGVFPFGGAGFPFITYQDTSSVTVSYSGSVVNWFYMAMGE